MASTLTSSSTTDIERKLPEKVGVSESHGDQSSLSIGIEENIPPSVLEYQQYLALHEQFDGAGRKKLLRKRK